MSSLTTPGAVDAEGGSLRLADVARQALLSVPLGVSVDTDVLAPPLTVTENEYRLSSRSIVRRLREAFLLRYKLTIAATTDMIAADSQIPICKGSLGGFPTSGPTATPPRNVAVAHAKSRSIAASRYASTWLRSTHRKSGCSKLALVENGPKMRQSPR